MSEYGFGSLLTMGDSNPKTKKSNLFDYDWLTAIMHLAPHKLCGLGNVCASASAGCIKACLNTAGRGRMSMTQQARINRTKLYFTNREKFVELLKAEIQRFVNKAAKLDRKPALRLNGTSDIIWEKVCPSLFTDFPQVQFYDYTKHAFRCMKSYKLPDNYHLTFSRSEVNDKDCRRILRSGKCNVAAVFNSKDYPNIFMGKPTYNADETDLRFLDPDGGHIGALYAKGYAKGDKTGFVISCGGV